jgi:hypothetical protein
LINQTDFLDLYGKLGLDSDCGVAEFKQAYRRHVAMLHPDRPTGIQTDPETAGPLQELIAQYGAAMEFYRRHGRLPGALMSSGFTMRDTAARPSRHPPAPPGASRSKLLVALATIGTGVLLWNIATMALLTDTTSTQTPANEDSEPLGPMVKPLLSIGMSADGVRAIEGEPLFIHGDRWEYGPSWISFDEGAVIDWYSSPLHPLRVADRRPPDKAVEKN